MTEDEIMAEAGGLGGVVVVTASEEGGAPEVAWGDSFFFYDPGGATPENQRMPFATIVTGNYPGFDEASDLDREGVFRLNLWVSRETFAGLFAGQEPADPAALDRVIPHPIYAAQSWVSILNPGERTDDQARALLREAHERAVQRFEARARRT
jgi:hypothetical protein